MIVKTAMTHKVVKIDPDATVREATKLMSRKGIGSIILTKGGKIVGIATERDVLNKVVAKGLNPQKTKIKDIMTSKVITIESKDPMEKACKIMSKKHIKRLPVVDNGKLVGIITATDVVKYEPRLAGYVYRLVTKKGRERTQKTVKTILLANIFFVWLLVTYAVIFIVFLRPNLDPSIAYRGVLTSLYMFIIVSTILSGSVGIMCFKLLAKMKKLQM